MMNSSEKTIIWGLILALLLCVGSYIGGRVHGRKIGYNAGYSAGFLAPHPSDTINRTDTLFIDRPVPVVEYVDRERPVYIAVHDTTRINDTTFVVLPREVKTYEDSTYRAQVSGVQPALDWIEVYQRTQTITQYIDHPAPRWSFGITAGPGVLWDGGFHAGLGIVAGLQYRF